MSSHVLILPDVDRWFERNGISIPGVVYDGEVFHMLYRSYSDLDRDMDWGYDAFWGCAVIGYAYSYDGVSFQRLNVPVLVPEKTYERCGVEDPRVTKLGDIYLMTYISLYRMGYPQISLTCLAYSADLINWIRLGAIDRYKGVAIFPEKINGRYCALMRRFPNVVLGYSDDLITWHCPYRLLKPYETMPPENALLPPRPGMWDSYSIAPGAPPVKTELGWLVFYNGFSLEDRDRKIGLAVLDLDNPEKVIYRSRNPIIEPFDIPDSMRYLAKSRFSTYCCGAVKVDDEIFLYYGVCDTMIGVSRIKLSEIHRMIDEGR